MARLNKSSDFGDTTPTAGDLVRCRADAWNDKFKEGDILTVIKYHKYPEGTHTCYDSISFEAHGKYTELSMASWPAGDGLFEFADILEEEVKEESQETKSKLAKLFKTYDENKQYV